MTGSEYRAARGLQRPRPGVPRRWRKAARRWPGVPRGLLRVPRRWLRLPRRTVRLRLTLVYGGLFLLSGAALLAITYLLVSRSLPTGPVTGRAAAPPLLTPGQVSGGTPGGVSGGKVFVQARAGSCGLFTGPLGTPAQVAARAQQWLSQQRALELKQLLTESGIALAIMTVVSIGLGWLVAGRVMGKLRTITAAARSISASSLHARLTLDGPDDELKELGDTFDGLLARQRTLIEVALADPEPSIAALQDVCTRVLATGEQQERLIEALLTLARSQRGLDRREPIDLAAIAGEVLEARRPEAELRGLTVTAALQPAPVLGDPRLAERLAANLVDNAICHNVAHGVVQITTGVRAGHAVLAVWNTGPLIPPDQVPRLFQPFQRSGADRTGTREGQGLGLSIVAAIAEAHGA